MCMESVDNCDNTVSHAMQDKILIHCKKDGFIWGIQMEKITQARVEGRLESMSTGDGSLVMGL